MTFHVIFVFLPASNDGGLIYLIFSFFFPRQERQSSLFCGHASCTQETSEFAGLAEYSESVSRKFHDSHTNKRRKEGEKEKKKKKSLFILARDGEEESDISRERRRPREEEKEVSYLFIWWVEE